MRSCLPASVARDSGMKRAASTTANSPTGMLTRKMGRQVQPKRSAWMSSPPTRGPVMAASPMTPPRMPKAMPRRCGGKVTWMTE